MPEYKLQAPDERPHTRAHEARGDRDLLPQEQKAIQKGRRGCLDARTIDAAVAVEAQMHRRDLSVGWIDYRKAYDMTPHRWITNKWQTDITVKTQQGIAKIPITLRRGLFQGDSLSPLLFCLTVAPLSNELREGRGFRSEFQRHPVTHLMFMDDLKVYEENSEKLESTLRKVEDISTAIGMSLGLRKCAVARESGHEGTSEVAKQSN